MILILVPEQRCFALFFLYDLKSYDRDCVFWLSKLLKNNVVWGLEKRGSGACCFMKTLRMKSCCFTFHDDSEFVLRIPDSIWQSHTRRSGCFLLLWYLRCRWFLHRFIYGLKSMTNCVLTVQSIQECCGLEFEKTRPCCLWQYEVRQSRCIVPYIDSVLKLCLIRDPTLCEYIQLTTSCFRLSKSSWTVAYWLFSLSKNIVE